MRAMGHQAAAALRETPDIRLVTFDTLDHPAPPRPAKPSVFVAAAVARQRQHAGDRVRALEADNAELRGEVAHLSRQLEVEREQGRREERAVKARTMGGRVLSIFVGGER